jgi:hypothetical protein
MAATETACPLDLDTLSESELTVNALEDTSFAVYAEATNRERELERELLRDPRELFNESGRVS